MIAEKRKLFFSVLSTMHGMRLDRSSAAHIGLSAMHNRRLNRMIHGCVTCHMRLDLPTGGATRKSATWNAKPSGRRPKQVDATSLGSSVSPLEASSLLA